MRMLAEHAGDRRYPAKVTEMNATHERKKETSSTSLSKANTNPASPQCVVDEKTPAALLMSSCGFHVEQQYKQQVQDPWRLAE